MVIKKSHSILLLVVSVFVFFGTLSRVHMRLQTTLTGYQLGALKKEEAKHLEELNLLKTNLAKLTTSESLLKMIQQAE